MTCLSWVIQLHQQAYINSISLKYIYSIYNYYLNSDILKNDIMINNTYNNNNNNNNNNVRIANYYAGSCQVHQIRVKTNNMETIVITNMKTIRRWPTVTGTVV